MDRIIKPQLTMKAKHTPRLSRREQIALSMQVVSLWLIDVVAMVIIWQTPMQLIYAFVCILIVFLLGCMFTGVVATHHYRSLLHHASMTQKVRSIKKSELAQMTHNVTMDTALYLEAVTHAK